MTPYTHGGDVLTARARFGGDVLDCSANQIGRASCRERV